jgi:hypothetical protein
MQEKNKQGLRVIFPPNLCHMRNIRRAELILLSPGQRDKAGLGAIRRNSSNIAMTC